MNTHSSDCKMGANQSFLRRIKQTDGGAYRYNLKTEGMGCMSDGDANKARRSIYAALTVISVVCTSAIDKNYEGGMATCGYIYFSKRKDMQIGAMIAGNSGRPGGAIRGLDGHVRLGSVHGGHKTQEEDMVSNWLLTTAGKVKHHMDITFSQIANVWGMISSAGVRTIQGIDYTRGSDPEKYADATTVTGNISQKLGNRFDTDNPYPVVLAFVAGPNANTKSPHKGRDSTMRRTFDMRAARDYSFFRDGVKAAVRAGLDSMAHQRVTVALVARVSCGLYAGVHASRINSEFLTLVQELLDERVGPRGELRGQYFHHVIVPGISRV